MPHPAPNPSHAQQGRQNGMSPIGFTDTSARFAVAYDGRKDCLAMTVTKTLVDKMNDMLQNDDKVDDVEGAIFHAKLDISSIEDSIQRAETSLSKTESETEKEELQHSFTQQQIRLLKLRSRKEQLETQCEGLKTELESSRIYALWVLESAMRTANLIRKTKPFKIPKIESDEPVHFENSQPMVSAGPIEPVISPKEIQRNAAYSKFRDSWDHLERAQRRFDSRERLYQEDLERHNQRCMIDSQAPARSELDRHHLKRGMRLTRALIEAESSFENAKEQVEALEEGSTPGKPSYGENNGQEYIEHDHTSLSAVDRSFIEAWRADVHGSEIDNGCEIMMTDVNDAGLIDIADSTSARDCGECRKKIDRWQQSCGTQRKFGEQQSGELLFGEDDLWRRHSTRY